VAASTHPPLDCPLGRRHDIEVRGGLAQLFMELGDLAATQSGEGVDVLREQQGKGARVEWLVATDLCELCEPLPALDDRRA
jgi:hypothetical protein